MIEYRKGDVLHSDMSIVIHQANCFHTFGSGIARQIREEFPWAYAADLTTVKGDKSKLGSFSYATLPEDQLVGNGPIDIYNLYGQYGYGGTHENNSTNYEALAKGFAAIAVDIKIQWGEDGGPEIGLPRIGCGLGGGEWEVVEALINEHLSDFQVYVYDLE